MYSVGEEDFSERYSCVLASFVVVEADADVPVGFCEVEELPDVVAREVDSTW